MLINVLSPGHTAEVTRGIGNSEGPDTKQHTHTTIYTGTQGIWVLPKQP